MGFRFQPTDLGLLVTLAMALLSARLVRLSLRTRQLPELLVGVYFVAAPLAISISIRIPRFDPAYADALRAAVAGLFTLGGVALLLFAWCVFHRTALWARALAWGGSAALVVVWAAQLAAGGFTADASVAPRLPAFASYLWVFVDSLRYWRLMKRRERLGLAEPVVVNRFLLFAVWTGGVVAITVLVLANGLVEGSFREEDTFGSAAVLGLTRLLSLPIGVSIYLTFLAPARYQDWLRRRSAAGSAG